MTRLRIAALALPVLLAVACESASPSSDATTEPTTPSPTEPTEGQAVQRGPFVKQACSLPGKELLRVWRGYHPERSGDIQYVPKAPNFVGSFSSHSGPWPYLQRVPMFWYGPGHVPPTGRVGRPVTTADLAPTIAELVQFDGFEAPEGSIMREAVGVSERPPKLVLTVVWDGGGRNVLGTYPRGWPNVRGIIPDGAWFENATVGSSPSVTPAIHSTMGTGAFPRIHGVVDLRFRIGDGVDPSAFERAQQLLVPALGDVYDLALDNRPVVGMVGAEGTLGMIGHGSGWEGGDKDVAAASRAGEWGLAGSNTAYFTFPDYVHEVPGLEEAAAGVDREDGLADGLWMGEDVLSDPDGLTLTPAYAEYQTGVIREIIRREGFGADAVPDLLFVNYKQIDKVGHKWSFPSPQMESVVASSDRAFSELAKILDREVGKGEWVMALTADHGSTPLAERTGATIISNSNLEEDIVAEFGPVVQSFRVTQIWLDHEELEARGHAEEDIARFVADYTAGQNAGDPSAVSDPDEKLMAAAFPSKILEAPLPCLPEAGRT